MSLLSWKSKAPPVGIASKVPTLDQRVAEIEYDLVRIADLLATGNIDGAKFREIVTKRQGKAKS